MNAKARRKLRLWPGVAIVALQWLFRFVVPKIAPDANIFGIPALFFGFLAVTAGGVLLALWWLFFSRAAWSERLGAVALMAAALFGARSILHPSVATAGMGRLFPVLALPWLCLAFVAWALATRRLPDRTRRVTMVATIVLACAGWGLLRTGGISGTLDSEIAWRWAPTAEDRLLARASDEPMAAPPPPAPSAVPAAPSPSPSAAPAAPAEAPAKAPEAKVEPTRAPPAAEPAHQTPARWPGFRGAERNGVVRGVRILTDWSASPPVQMWRRAVGPGWSSFAVDGDVFYTQEQRGDDEIVSAYRLSSGQPVWRHRNRARFWESLGGAGPRATPTLSRGRVYAFGATGILNALDARTGAVLWTRNAADDTQTKTPGWGFASSPLVVGDLVIVATSGTLGAFDAASGTPRWVGPKRNSDYSSPQLATIDGVPQVLLLSGTGATSVAPADGAVLWEHKLTAGSRIVQPGVIDGGELLMSNGQYGEGNGLRRVSVTRGPDGWTSQEKWATTSLKPDFNDYVVHQGHVYGFDGGILACVDVEDGQRKWKGGRYGHGQLVLLPDQDLLLVLSEEGELALVAATPQEFRELARAPAIEGKTWNHPVVVDDVLLVRNGQEMAAFRLTLAKTLGLLGRSPRP